MKTYRYIFLYVSILLLTPLNFTAAVEPEFKLLYEGLKEGRVAFSYTLDDKTDIFVLDLSDGKVSKLINSPGKDEAPNFSPDGNKIVYHSDMSGNKEIYIAGADGSDVTQLTSSKGNSENATWSPDGKKIVFQTNRRAKSGDEVFIMNVDGSEQGPLLPRDAQPNLKNVTPRFSPLGDEVAYVTNDNWPGWDILIFNINKKNIIQLTEGQGSYIRPSWSPNGLALSFSYRTGNRGEIWLAQKGKSDPQPLIQKNVESLDPCWHDTEKVMFFVAENNPEQKDYQLFILDRRIPNDKSNMAADTYQLLSSKGVVRGPTYSPFPTLSSLRDKLKQGQAKAAK